MDLKEIDIDTRNWVGSTQVRDYWRALVNAALAMDRGYLVKMGGQY